MNKPLVLGALGGVLAYLVWKNASTTYSVDLGDGGDDSVSSTLENIVSAITGTPTRGERNNNPGNIRHSSAAWQGMAADQSGDSAFVVFDSPEYGIRALARLMQNYYKDGLHSVRQIINKYAPSSENDTSSYVTHVSNLIGATPDMALDLSDLNTLHALVSAIIMHENGRNIYADNGQLDAGVGMLA